MAERYIRRATLPAQHFPLNCPVSLAVGALLEDTQQPRLVGQLKWLAPRGVVTALTVLIRCQADEAQTLPFRYPAFRSIPGCPFGQYVAIPLPAGTAAFQVEVEEVVFQRGVVWSREAEQAKAQAAREAAEQAAAAKAAEQAQAQQAKAERPTQARVKEKSPRPPKAAADNKPAKGKALAAVAVVGVVAVLAAAILLPKLGGKPSQAPSSDENAPAAVDDTVPTQAAGDAAAEVTETPQPTTSPTPSPVFSSMDLGETGDVAEVYIHRDQSGYFPLTPDAFLDYVPNATTTCTRMGKDLGGDVIAYLKDSFSFAWYVTQDDPNRGISGDGTMYPPKDGVPPILCVLAFSGEGSGKLVGYFIGQPLEVDQDTIRIDLTLCDFDLAPLYEQERDAFLAGADLLDVERVAPDTDFEALGVEYYLPGFYTSETDRLTRSDCQYYHLWQALTAPDPRCYAVSVQSLQTYLARSAPREHYHYQFLLLLDKDFQPIAYTWHY